MLFDEVEKASDSLWNLMLGILDKATLTLGDNRVVDFSKVIILMTSNLGSEQMETATEGGLGYNVPKMAHDVADEKIEKVAKEAAKRKFSPEFWNRLNQIVVFKTLTQDQIGRVLDVELEHLQEQLLFNSIVNFFFHVKPRAKQALLKEGYSKKYGARHLNREVEKRITTPLARLVASGQVIHNDTIVIDSISEGEFQFYLEEGHAQALYTSS